MRKDKLIEEERAEEGSVINFLLVTIQIYILTRHIQMNNFKKVLEIIGSAKGNMELHKSWRFCLLQLDSVVSPDIHWCANWNQFMVVRMD